MSNYARNDTLDEYLSSKEYLAGIDIEKFKILKKFLEENENKKFNMNLYIGFYDSNLKEYVGNINQDNFKDVNICNTACCLAGYSVLLFKPEIYEEFLEINIQMLNECKKEHINQDNIRNLSEEMEEFDFEEIAREIFNLHECDSDYIFLGEWVYPRRLLNSISKKEGIEFLGRLIDTIEKGKQIRFMDLVPPKE